MAHLPPHSDSSPPSPPPRIVIVGAGIAGLSAARLLSSLPPHSLRLTVLEASASPGGRIRSATFSGHRIELGATWIHGSDGSPIYDLAQRAAAAAARFIGGGGGDDDDHLPWECMDGLPCSPPDLLLAPSSSASRRSVIPPSIAHPIDLLYRSLFSVIQHTSGGLHQLPAVASNSNSPAAARCLRDLLVNGGGSIGAYLQEGLRRYLLASSRRADGCDIPMPEEYAAVSAAAATRDGGRGSFPALSACDGRQPDPPSPTATTTERLERAIFRMHENVERCVTGADSLHDLSLEANQEYWEYPGNHITVRKGYSSVVRYLEAGIPNGTIQFNKRVRRISWLAAAAASGRGDAPVRILCEDGTYFDADHVIITVSLGVLKAEALTGAAARICRDRHVPVTAPAPSDRGGLFEPPLPAWKQNAIAKLGFGVVDKCFFSMKPASPGAIYPHAQLVYPDEGEAPAVPRWMRRNFSFYPIHRRSNVLCIWLIGGDAMEAEGLKDEEVAEGIVETMEAFGYGELKLEAEEGGESGGDERRRAEVGAVCRGKWGSDGLFRGSYSYVAVGASGEDIDRLAEPLPGAAAEGNSKMGGGNRRRKEAAPPLQLLFAGEATHRFCYSTTSGAYLSGVREAERLMELYGWVAAGRAAL